MFSNSGMQIQNQGILGEIVCGVNLTGASCSSKVFGDQLRWDCPNESFIFVLGSHLEQRQHIHFSIKTEIFP